VGHTKHKRARPRVRHRHRQQRSGPLLRLRRGCRLPDRKGRDQDPVRGGVPGKQDIHLEHRTADGRPNQERLHASQVRRRPDEM